MLQCSALIDVLDLEGIGGNERVLSFFRSSAGWNSFLRSLGRISLAVAAFDSRPRSCRDSVLGHESMNLDSSYHQHGGGSGLSVSGKSELRQDNGRGRRCWERRRHGPLDRLMGRQTTDALDDILRAERAE